jgi:hypothetical protein
VRHGRMYACIVFEPPNIQINFIDITYLKK